MKRSELKKLTATRLKDARILLDTRRYAACFYLAGYAVECALKACIAKKFHANTIPTKVLVNSIYQHGLDKLIGVAELKQNLKQESDANPDFEANWNVVKDWQPNRRYELGATRQEAQDLYDAINDPIHGVLQWLHRHW